MRKWPSLLLMPVFMLVVAMPFQAGAGEARERLADFFATVITFDARFSQTVSDDSGVVIQESSGTVQLLRPGRFRWSYERPFKQLIVADGQYLWIYDKELEQATVKSIGDALGAAPIMLLSELRPLEEDFLVLDEAVEGGLQWVTLQPKVRDTDFVEVRIGMDGDKLREMQLRDQFQQETRIHFTKVKLNPEIPAARFRFEAPAGVDVIRAGE